MDVRVQETAEGFIVTKDGNVLSGPFDTNSQAWRWIDRWDGEPISRSEHVSQWSWNQRVNGE